MDSVKSEVADAEIKTELQFEFYDVKEENFTYSDEALNVLETCNNENWKMKEETKENLKMEIKEEEFVGDKNFGHYFCDVCECSFANEECLSTHLQSVHFELKNELLDKCEIDSNASKNYTQQIVSNKDEKFMYEECGNSFKTNIIQEAHVKEKWKMKEGTEDNLKIKIQDEEFVGDKNFGHYFCVVCECSFANEECLSTHLQYVHFELNNKLWDKCEIDSNASKNYAQQIVANKDEKFMCDECGNSFKTNSNQEAHVKAVHQKERPFKCSECDYKFSVKCSLSRHILAIHKNEKPFHCSECDYKSSTQSNLSQHIRAVHKNEKPFSCSECDYKSNFQCNLSKHIRAIHKNEKPFECSDCNFKYSIKESLSKHISVVHKNEKPFECSECDYKSSSKYHLSVHIRAVHKKEKPFECSECDYCSSYKKHLSRHILAVHKYAKSFDCSECDYKCSAKSHLSVHKRAVHKTRKTI